jgi:hypothetical protein
MILPCTLNHGADGPRPVVATFLAGPVDPVPTSVRPSDPAMGTKWARWRSREESGDAQLPGMDGGQGRD